MKVNLSFGLKFLGVVLLAAAAWFSIDTLPRVLIFAGAASFGVGKFWDKLQG